MDLQHVDPGTLLGTVNITSYIYRLQKAGFGGSRVLCFKFKYICSKLAFSSLSRNESNFLWKPRNFSIWDSSNMLWHSMLILRLQPLYLVFFKLLWKERSQGSHLLHCRSTSSIRPIRPHSFLHANISVLWNQPLLCITWKDQNQHITMW